MAVYELKCQSCGCIFDEIRPMSDSSKNGKCPKCGKKAQRIYSSSIGIIIN